MVKKWKGIREIKEKATKELIEIQENGYLFYSAPVGYKLVLTVVINEPPAWKMEIKDFGIAKNSGIEKILRRGFSEGDERFITEDDEPTLELIEEERMEVDEIKRRIENEWRKARSRVQGRGYS